MQHPLLEENGIQLWDQATIKAFRASLLGWYDANKRDLPWRRTSDPYAIWVSEIMLQQTQVATVIPYFERFMASLPTIADLAKAPEETLLKLWEGLGYYSRVRNLQKAAQEIMERHGGQMPRKHADILKLKGIGPYTAGAIASIAFQQPTPAVDGNVMRVMARLFEINLDIGDPKNRKVFEYLTAQLIDPLRPGDFNQALMDLGSDICSAKNPRPEESPLKAFNAAYQHGTMDIYPIKGKKQKQKDLYYKALAVRNPKGQFLFYKRPDTGLLANLWTFPLLEVDQNQYDGLLSVGQISHVFSHLKWHIEVLVVEDQSLLETLQDNLVAQPHHQEARWIAPEDFQSYPFPTPQVKIFHLLGIPYRA